ncbi:hypothetical protein DACRYDRAFT_110998 [Dacryopinax primogenitus]|uniref:ATPase dynein-related AAA domain-containing protein n=1 Tax=Dacryopinax primogenitus (strain DJM 731) TaxID=1858805 RepID=M5FNW9_DACPD|nr:uncharacterized protein DACRYDRAFT_110998 [Dacryopinax primogenitus]EJT98015.1 hypothetical protein DACRYDRAFT_110998 [Dacryopinax primogenitus]
MLQHLAQMVHGSASQIVSIHLADTSLDAKSLLGTYASSSVVPGLFDWVDGPLVHAMKLGKWLVLGDIDRAAQDVPSTLLPLLESMGSCRRIGSQPSVDVLGRGQVFADNEFMVFATRSVPCFVPIIPAAGNSRPFSAPRFLGHQHFSEITLPVPTLDKLPLIIHEGFPNLHDDLIPLIIRIWNTAREAISVLQGDAKDIDLLMQRLSKTERDLAAIDPPPITRSSNPNIIDAFFGEIEQFMQQVLDTTRVDRLLHDSTEEAARPQTLRMAEVIDHSIDAFVQRIREMYAPLFDLVFGAILCMRSLQVGIKLASRVATLEETKIGMAPVTTPFD